MAQTYTVKQVADTLGYSTNSIYTFLKEKRIKGVRLGKGRFRIPQTEVNRLLGEKTPIAKIVVSSPSVQMVQPAIQPAALETPTLPLSVIAASVSVPSLFDWFTGISALMLGVSTFLFSGFVESIQAAGGIDQLGYVRWSLMLCGISLICEDMIGLRGKLMHRLTKGLLALVYLVLAAFFYYSGQLDVWIIPSVMGAALAFSLITGLGGTKMFGLLSSVLLITLPASALVTGGATIPEILTPLPLAPIFLLWLVAAIGLTVVFWYGWYSGSPRMLNVGATVTALGYLAISYLYAYQLFWGLSMVLMTAGLSIGVFPQWVRFRFAQRRDRRILFAAWYTIGAFMLIALAVVHFMQQNVIQFARSDMEDKAVYGKLFIESALDSARLSVENGATNPELLSAIGSGRTEDMLSFLRILYDSRSNFNRFTVHLVDSAEAVAVYPHTVEAVSAGTDTIYGRAVANRKTQFSEVIMVSNRPTILIVSPVMDAKGAVVGALTGYVDLFNIGHKLRQVANPSRNEFVTLRDRVNHAVISGNNTVNKVAFESESDIVAASLLYENRWVVEARTPVSGVVRASGLHAIQFVVVLMLSAGIILIFSLTLKRKVGIPQNTS